MSKNVGLSTNDEPQPSEWKEVSATEDDEDMLHGGGTSIVVIETMLYAISVYGTLEHDRVWDTTQPNNRYDRY